MGALRRTLAADVAATPRSSSRAFSVSARRFDESNNAAPSAPAAAKPDSRKARAANALSQITRLGANRRSQPGGLAKGNFPSGQTDGQPARSPARVRPDGSLKITREPTGPTGSAPPPGAMARAPARLKLSRSPNNNPSAEGSSAPRAPRGPGNATVGSRRGPNLRGRDRKPGSGKGSQGGPKKRGMDKEATAVNLNPEEVKIESVLSDTMVQHLLRLQRSEWDRKAYVPKYAPGSFAANSLVHVGRELCRGQSPPVKVWGKLERRIGVVGMHNAEAHLRVRRVADMDEERLGERREYFESGDDGLEIKVPEKVKAKAATAAKTPAVKAPAKKAAAKTQAAAKAPATKQSAVVQ